MPSSWPVCLTGLPGAGARRGRQGQCDPEKDAAASTSWVTIGGFSVLDGANVPTINTTFVVYDDWSKRGAALSQEKIIAGLNRELSAIQDAMAFVIDTAAHQGPRPDRRLSDDAGRPQGQRPPEPSECGQPARRGSRNSEPAFRALQRPSTPIAPRSTWTSTGPRLSLSRCPSAMSSTTLQGYLGSSFVNLFNKFNQVYPGLHPGRRALTGAVRTT